MTLPPTHPAIEELLPHRGKMLLIDEIVCIDGDTAASKAVPNDQWPMVEDASVHSLILVELVAQTSGLSNGLECLNTEGPGTKINGWLVGIKNAIIKVPTIALGEAIITETKNSFKFEGFREIEGICKINHHVIGEMTLQVMRAQ